MVDGDPQLAGEPCCVAEPPWMLGHQSATTKEGRTHPTVQRGWTARERQRHANEIWWTNEAKGDKEREEE